MSVLLKIGDRVFDPTKVFMDLESIEVDFDGSEERTVQIMLPGVYLEENGKGDTEYWRLRGSEAEALRWWVSLNATDVIEEYRKSWLRPPAH